MPVGLGTVTSGTYAPVNAPRAGTCGSGMVAYTTLVAETANRVLALVEVYTIIAVFDVAK